MTLGREEGFVGEMVGLADDMLGLAASTHCPQDDAAAETRVPPVLDPQVPVRPVIVTREPVAALIPPPETHAVPPPVPSAVVANGIQLPCVPGERVELNAIAGSGLPTPVYPESEVKRHPAEQYKVMGKQTAGQSPGRAYTYVFAVPPVVVIGYILSPWTSVKLLH